MAEAARERKGLPVDDKVHTWPHLVRMEFLVALFVIVGLDPVVDYDQRAVGRAGESDAHAQSFKGAVVFSRFAGDAGLLRSLACRRSVAEPYHCRLDGDSFYRHQPERQRLLLLQRPEVGDPDLYLWFSRSLGCDDHHRDLFPRSGLEPILAMAEVGSA